MSKGATIIWSLACVGGIGVVTSASVDYWSSSVSRNWPVVQGQILDSALRERVGPKGPSYWADIRYSYEASGRRHIGTTVRFGPEIESRPDAQQAVTKFPAGKQV